MKSRMVVFSVSVVFMMLMPLRLSAQDHAEQIRAVRAASNAALKALDEGTNLNYLTDDALITTGSGTLIKGKTPIFRGKYVAYWVLISSEWMIKSQLFVSLE